MQRRGGIYHLLILRITLLALCHGFCSGALLAQAPRAPGVDEVYWQAATQASDGVWRRLRGNVEMRQGEMVLRADEVDYNEETGEAEARGNVHFFDPGGQEDVYAARFSYNLKTQNGVFYQVHGTARSAGQAGPQLLVTNEPFYFQGEMAQKIQGRYIVHRGLVTNCRRPNPWWTLATPKATITPGRHAVLRHAVFRLKKIPLFYTPIYYKSLERAPRSSGFLTPNLGNSSRRGRVLGTSFFWAPKRSYDVTAGGTYFTQRGFAHQITARGRPSAASHFDAFWFAMNDRGFPVGEGAARTRHKQGGRMLTVNGATQLGRGFYGAAAVNYLSSLEFRLAFTETYNEAIFSEVHSTGFLTKAFSTFFFNAALIRTENFQTTRPGDTIVIRKLPSIEFNSREHELVRGPLPVWFTLDSSFELLGRRQPGFRTRQLAERLDVTPRVLTRLEWKGFRLVPAFGLHNTYYGEQRREEGISGEGLRRTAREFTVELAPPALARVFQGPRVFADRLKHVIEPRLSYRYVAGAPDFRRVIRFDEHDLLNNTSEAEIALLNRFYGKREATGEVRELLSVEIWQRRYFDPGFGGALADGSRNVLRSTIDLTPYAFADTPRRYSPVVSVLRIQPRYNYAIEWRNDYDPRRGKLVASGLAADASLGDFTLSLGHHAVRATRALAPPSNELRTMARYGSINKRGWNVGANVVYDYRQAIMPYANAQATYNTDCCGFSVEYRRFALGPARNENQFRLALSIANVGSFGTLKKQERMF